MCGIAARVGKPMPKTVLDALAHRGPDACGYVESEGVSLAHTRLSIIDLDSRSDQPMTRSSVTAVFNGELWNYRELRSELSGYQFTTEGDTEVIITALAEWGEAPLVLDGMFAIAWTEGDGVLYAARDRFGEIPLHITYRAVASELKALADIGEPIGTAQMLPPGAVARIDNEGCNVSQYHVQRAKTIRAELDEAAGVIRDHLDNSVRKRLMADVPICTLLSGGVDSSAIASQLPKGATAYVAKYDESSMDLRRAREVAEALSIDLIEVECTLPNRVDLAKIIRLIEMPYKAQVEIGWLCYQLAERIASDGFKVVYSGEGSDELWASYGFAYHGLKTQGWHHYRRALFLGQHQKNFPRANKIFMAKGIECRLPFLDPPLVDYALSLPQEAVQDGKQKPKAVLQRAYADILPESVTRRAKMAFQDGAGIKTAITETIESPTRFYRATYKSLFAEATK